MPGELKNKYFYRKNFQCNVRGFIVPREFIANQSLAQLEHSLGFAKGRLDQGAAFAQLNLMPAAAELEYFGDTSAPEHSFEQKRNKGISKTDLSNAAYQYLRPGTKLIKVIPLKDHDPLATMDQNWPAGKGAMQFKLKVIKPAVIIDVIENYPHGIFR